MIRGQKRGEDIQFSCVCDGLSPFFWCEIDSLGDFFFGFPRVLCDVRSREERVRGCSLFFCDLFSVLLFGVRGFVFVSFEVSECTLRFFCKKRLRW